MSADGLLLLARLALAAVFAVAAAGKLADLRGSQAAAQGFGVPERFARAVGTALPCAELAIAAALVVDDRAGYATLALLLVLTAGVARAMRRGDAIECHCFGAIHSAPVGWKTLARNGVLALLALAVVTGVPAVAVAAALVGIGLGCAQLVATRRATRPRQAPSVTVASLDGEAATLESLRAPGKPLLLLFTDPGCGPCHALLPEASRWQDELAGELSVAVIATGSADDNRTAAEEYGLDSVYIQDARTVSAALGVTATPSGVLVNADGTITRAVAPGADAIRTLLPGVLDPRPRELTALDGELVDLAHGRRRTLLVFWNPDCGYCRQIEDDLVEWEATRLRSDPRFVVVARGDEAKLRELPFAAPVVHDQDGSLMAAFGAPGTPSAVLVERDGSVVAPVAIGGPDTLGLASDRVERRELIRSAGVLVALVSALSPAAALGAVRKHCPPGRKLCGTRCCGKGFSCKTRRVRGKAVKQCVCLKPRQICGKSCVNRATDPKNCGACGKVCAPGQTCQAGHCAGGTQQQPAPTDQQPAPTDQPPAQQQEPAPTCSDGKKNGSETDVDCGGPTCPKCANGKTCTAGSDCTSGYCGNGVCMQPPQCTVAADCPQGAVGDCQKAVCTGGVCGFAADDTDVPTAPNECQTAVCTSGTPSFPSKATGTACSTGMCDGAGTCVQCLQASDCPPGAAGDCQKPVCNSGTCGVANDDTDTPAASGDCYNATCTGGTPSMQPKGTGAPCNSSNGHFCDGAGSCVECLQPSDCPGSDSACGTRTCTSNTCGMTFAPSNTPCGAGGHCDGNGICLP